MWQDGVVEGDKETARQRHAFDRQRSEHLRALLKILRGRRCSITGLRDEISRTRPPDVEIELRDCLIEQLDRFAGQHLSSEGFDFDTWLGRTVIDQEQWLARIVYRQSCEIL